MQSKRNQKKHKSRWGWLSWPLLLVSAAYLGRYKMWSHHFFLLWRSQFGSTFLPFENLCLVSDHFSWQSYARNKKRRHMTSPAPVPSRGWKRATLPVLVFFSLIHFTIMENTFSQNKGTTKSWINLKLCIIYVYKNG